MIRGIVTDDREALIRLIVFGSGGRKRSVETAIDTGYDGYLSLPPDIIARLGLVWRRRGKAELADGSETAFDIFEGVVLWDGRRREILIDEANSAPLIGTSLLVDHLLQVEVWSGGRVTIRRR